MGITAPYCRPILFHVSNWPWFKTYSFQTQARQQIPRKSVKRPGRERSRIMAETGKRQKKAASFTSLSLNIIEYGEKTNQT
jgi:hypothetical protein